MSTAANFDDIEILAEPDHVYPWEALSRKLDVHVAHIEEDRTFKVAIEARVQGIEAQLTTIAKAASSGSRWARVGTAVGAALAASGIVDRLAHHFPGLLSLIGG